ncbi:MAG: lytic transglycosylase domain-containing protein [Deltaproteobacteria bacterium]|jgi:hypothetical protein|nr:lytic transglycosylase domain-containing protein [Deltaproteobacteria bacterium]
MIYILRIHKIYQLKLLVAGFRQRGVGRGSRPELSSYPALFALLIIWLFLTVGMVGCKKELEGLGPESWGPSEPYLGRTGAVKVDYTAPIRLSLCGEALPLDRPAVRERLEAEFLLAAHHPAQIGLWRRRAKRYFPAIEAALKASGLPDDLKYLAVAESDLRPTVFSPAGAAGIWQFIPSTARRYGLAVNKKEDQRLLAEPVLGAGLKYLKVLRDRFGDWALAMAAYNAGEARIGRAIKDQGFNDYYELRLPRETERYVYRIAAIKAILSEPLAYGLNNSTPPSLYQPVKFQETERTFKEPIAWTDLAQQLNIDYKELRSLNPHLANQEKLSGGPYLFRIPKKS